MLRKFAAALLLLLSGCTRPEFSEAATTDYSLSDVNTSYMLTSAFAAAYPEIITGPVWKNDDWVLHVRGTEFYWAKGRLLNEETKAEPEKYGSHRFYEYPAELPSKPGQRRRGKRFRASLLRGGPRNMEFFKTLLNTWQRSDMVEENLVEMSFLGLQAKIHRMLLPALKRIEQSLTKARSSDPELESFLKSLRSTSGYIWRNIAGTQRLSLHSYGIAIDLIPRSWIGEPYWLWVKRKGLDWNSYPYEKRWQVPDIVVKTFEREGFTWGGKWRMFDTMHFEYHPEIRLFKPEFF